MAQGPNYNIISPFATGSSSIPFTASKLTFPNGTVLTDTANGTLQITTATGTFGTILLGAATSTTGVKLVSSNGVLAIQDGGGGATIQTQSNVFLSANGGSNGIWVGTSSIYGGAGSGTRGSIAFPTTTTGTVAFTQATGTLTGPGFSFNGNISLANSTYFGDTANGTFQIATSSGGFGTLLLGGPTSTTGMKLTASNGLLAVTEGDGTAAGQFQTPSGSGSTIGLLVGSNSGISAASQLNFWYGGSIVAQASSVAMYVNGVQAFGTTWTPSQFKWSETHSSGATALTTGQSGGTYYASANTAWTLPAPSAGANFRFIVTAASLTVTVATANTGTQSIFGTSITGGTRTAPATAYSVLQIECADGANWVITTNLGPWT